MAKEPKEGAGELRSAAEVRTAIIEGQTFGRKAIQYTVVDGLAMFEGDIVLGTVEQLEAQTRQFREELATGAERAVVITGAKYRWPGCKIPYTIDPNLTNTARVTDAIAHWEANTRFRFILRTAENAATYPDYVTFRPGSGCSSVVGRRGGQQFVTLGSECSTGNCIHEIGHTVGLWHEQSREDRDSFVTINWAKIQSGMEHNFNQHITDGDDVGAYDYGSIMHYPRNAFSVDGSDTITPTTAGVTIGQRTALSAGDIAAVNAMCPKKSPLVDIRTANKHLDDIHTSPLLDQLDRFKILQDGINKRINDVKAAGYDVGWRELPGQPFPVGTGTKVPFALSTPHHAGEQLEESPAVGSEVALAESIRVLDARLTQLEAAAVEAQSSLEAIFAERDAVAAGLRAALQAAASVNRGG